MIVNVAAKKKKHLTKLKFIKKLIKQINMNIKINFNLQILTIFNKENKLFHREFYLECISKMISPFSETTHVIVS